MSQPDGARPEPGPDADIGEIQSDIEQTRKDLGETVEALTAKMDVKQRTKEAVVEKAHAVQHATIDDGRAKVTVPVATAIVVGTAALVWLLWRRRR